MLKPQRPDVSSERGVAMIIVLLALIAGSMISAAALAAASGDLPFARDSQDRKQAYAAAESGLEYYLFQLSQDNDYWTRCTNVPAPSASEPSPVNQAWNGNGADPRRWRRVPGSTTAEYTIELLPAAGNASCVQGQANATFLDRTTGTFRVRATGRSNGITRSLVTTMRRSSFLDYIYFTDLETQDPEVYASANDRVRAAANCVQPRAGRDAIRSTVFDCEEIQFSGSDGIRGPLHTNDDILTCGGTTLGRAAGTGWGQRPSGSAPDAIEVSGPAGWQNASGCSGQPTMRGTWINPTNTLTMPTSNNSLESVALPQYRYTGTTRITLRGSVMDVTNSAGQTTTDVPLPANGVIYVRNGACTGVHPPRVASYDESSGCAQLYLSGTYSSNLTIASANDIVITGDVRMATGSDTVLGLIANNFVRVQHRVQNRNSSGSSCDNRTPVLQNVRIDAAILTLTHSFIVDNFACGARMGTLTVNGAIAQRFRGPVGTTAPTGYTKDYVYDDRLKYRSPPFFLDPVAAAWKVARSNEQVPATAQR